MFLEYLYNLPNSTEGLDAIVVQTVTAVPGFTPMLLAFVYFIIFLGGVSKQKARTGTADYAMWSTVASMSMMMMALIMSMVQGIINLDVLVIVTVITIFSAVWLFFDRKQSEI